MSLSTQHAQRSKLKAQSSTFRRGRAAVFILLTVHAALLANLAARYSPTVDEVGHLPAGLYTWEFGRFDLFRVNPPLVRMVAALPVRLAGPEYDWTGYRTGLTDRPEWGLGRDLMRANGERSFRYFTWARWMLIPVSLLGGLVCFRWGRELYGENAGLTALTMWCFSPTVLAYGALITPDLSAAAMGVTAAYTYWRWLREPNGIRTFVAGVSLGLAQLTKMTWLVLFPLWPMLWIVWRSLESRTLNVEDAQPSTLTSQCSILNPQPTALCEAVRLAAVLAIGLYVLNIGYGLDGTFQRLGEYRFVSCTLSGESFAGGETEVGGNRFMGTRLARIPVPLPRDYLTGMDLQKREFEQGKWSYLRGEWRHGGWWWWYLYAAAVKEPLGTWCLLGLAVIAAWKAPPVARALSHATPPGARVETHASKMTQPPRVWRARKWRDTLVLLAPGILLFALVSSQTGFNRYLRYVLPAYPFALIWASQAVRLVEFGRKWWGLPIGGALLWSVLSSLCIYPHSLSYFNEAAGGPAGGHEHLIDANIDWGQDLFELRDWLKGHPEAAPVGVACQAFVPLDILGVEFEPVPGVPEPGWFIVSRHDRHRRDGAFEYFDRFMPVDRIGESMDVYHVTPDEAERVRGAMSASAGVFGLVED